MLSKHLGLYEKENQQKGHGIIMNVIQTLPLETQIEIAEAMREIANQEPKQITG